MIWRWLPALAMMSLIFLASSMPASRLPYFGLLDRFLKAGGHAIGYGFLSLAYFYALPPRLSAGYRMLMSLVMSLLFALSDEFHQSFVEGRTSSLGDVAIDGIGAAVALLLFSVYPSNSNSESIS